LIRAPASKISAGQTALKLNTSLRDDGAGRIGPRQTHKHTHKQETKGHAALSREAPLRLTPVLSSAVRRSQQDTSPMPTTTPKSPRRLRSVPTPIRPGQRLLMKPQVLELLNVSFPTLYDWMRKDQFPHPIELGPPDGKNTALGWLAEEVDEWISSRPRRKFRPKPESETEPRATGRISEAICPRANKLRATEAER
jgi:predicted DNA-binding transcriptional regulator AlpA